MRRGTTPTLTLTIPYEASEINSGYITFAQDGITILEKELSDEAIVISDQEIDIYLTQAETLAFKTTGTNRLVRLQCRLKLTTGEVVASNIVEFYVRPILKDGEI